MVMMTTMSSALCFGSGNRIGCLLVPRATGVLWDYSLRAMSQRIGFKHVIEFDAFDSMTPGPDMEFVSIPFHGEHGELFAAKTCWLVRLGTSKCFSRQTPIRLTLAPTRASGRSPETSKTVIYRNVLLRSER